MIAALVLAIAFLLMLCATLAVLLIGRDRAATREEARLDRIADDLATELTKEQAKVRHLTERVAEYRGEVSRLAADNGELMAALTVEPSLTEAVYATLAELPLTDPEDIR